MTAAPVGIRCPEHAGGQRVVHRPAGIAVMAAPVTRALLALNIAVYVAELATGGGVNGNRGWIFEHGALFGPLVGNGDWWRLITAAFLHYGPIHLGLNMLGLWYLGTPLERAIGRWRFLALYLVSGLAGSAGALVNQPNAVTVGASGAIFGVLGAILILEYRTTGTFAGPALTLLVINLAFSFAVPGIAIGGHIGGAIGGVLGMIALSLMPRRWPARTTALAGYAALAAVGAVSVAIAYWKVRGYAA